MPRKKKTEEVAQTVAEVKDVEVVQVAEETAEEEKPAKKTTKKTTTKKTTTPRKKKEVEPVIDFFVEFNGEQESYANVVENIKKSYLAENDGAVISEIKVYLKPQDSKAYCVINGEINYDIDVYFV